jgi:hypothetical protein
MLPSLTLLERFVRFAPLPWPAHKSSCCAWPGACNDKGYGKLTHERRAWYVHRIAYGIAHGWVPPELDHLCRNRACWNPAHLEAVSHRENCRRAGICHGETCGAGHIWAEVGWWEQKNGRKCKACHRKRARESAQRKKAREAG